MAAGHVDRELVRWFKYWLHGEGDINEIPLVRYFELGSNVWRTANAWPVDTIEEHKVWYLTSVDDPANGALGGGNLCEGSNPSHSSLDLFVYDARLPMPCESFLPVDRSEIQQRNEILVYTSSPLPKPIHVAGSPRVVVWVNALGGPTDLVVVLTVVGEDGTAKFLSIGRGFVPSLEQEVNIGYIDHAQNSSMDGWLELTIMMRPIAVQLKQGESIRLELTGSAFPLIARYPNHVNENELAHIGPEKLQIATVAVASSSHHPSRIYLPVIRPSESEV
ncbi:hypothetical protein GCM10010885_22570 [Alicyclobacillus cellulosilyticus]|uniref:Xaa-Pro dipeptidyl-peptidase C-terminal domain-containing protein n=2 Tax=Alicyclobacillus cellulosilyticus TaxID=1003997 RepID=A0A917KHM0_9BACL|nr:hypothetical protein GCM10010885_22570 [Alicyclobacillus cellulosilyticus]